MLENKQMEARSAGGYNRKEALYCPEEELDIIDCGER